MKKVVFFFSLCLFLSSCSPLMVGKMITKSYPPQRSDAPVEVYYSKEEIPQHAESLGVANVKDKGFSSNCDSITAINLLKTEVRKAGGNAIHISKHLPPSYWGSPCHQMMGTILKVGGFAEQGNDTTAREQTTGSFVDIKVVKPERKYPRARFDMQAGYAYRTPKISEDLDAEQAYLMGKLKSGANIAFAFDYFPSDYLGFGMMYSSFRSIVNVSGKTTFGVQEIGVIKHSISLIAPELVGRLPIGEKFSVEIKYALGYIAYKSKETAFNETYISKGGNLGSYLGVNLEYKFAKSCGLFLNTALTGGSIDKVDVYSPDGRRETVKMEEGVREGLHQVHVDLGIRFFIK